MVSKFLPLFMLMLMLSGFVSCDHENVRSVDVVSSDTLPAETLYDVSYGSDTLQRFDVFLPAQRSSSHTKLIVLIHGGGWTSGDKIDSRAMIFAMAQRYPDYAVANLNYRINLPDTSFLDGVMDDINAALRELSKKEYQLSTEVAFYGASSGGHLALLYAYRYDKLHNVKVVIAASSPVDLTDNELLNSEWFRKRIQMFTASPRRPDYQQLRNSSPLFCLKGNSPPTLCVFGDSDELIPVSQASKMDSALKANNIPSKVIVYAGEKHEDWKLNDVEDLLQRMDTFLLKNF